MKKRYIFIAIIICGILFWIGSIIYVDILTRLHGNEFTDFEAIGFDYMHHWEGNSELRVLSYSSNEAKVYFFKESGGIAAIFVKTDGKWVLKDEVASWIGPEHWGNADDYFIWPYFKNYVP